MDSTNFSAVDKENLFKWSWGALLSLPSVRIAFFYGIAVLAGSRLAQYLRIDLSQELRVPLILFNLCISLANLATFSLFCVGLLDDSVPSVFVHATNRYLHSALNICYILKLVSLESNSSLK